MHRCKSRRNLKYINRDQIEKKELSTNVYEIPNGIH